MGGVIGFASRGEAMADVVSCITLLVIEDDEICLARMDSLEMGGGGGKRKLLGFKKGYGMSGIVCNGIGGGEDTCMLGLGRPRAWGAGIVGWEGEVLVVGLSGGVEGDAGGWTGRLGVLVFTFTGVWDA